tara:strand:+ start:40 stop:159 length:120 start_codon:yes stop_codon:yes gene_type:complete
MFWAFFISQKCMLIFFETLSYYAVVYGKSAKVFLPGHQG